MSRDMYTFLGLKRPGAVHPPGRKFTSNEATEVAPLPKEVMLPLQQHIGAPANPLVNKGDEVKVGQKIAEASGFVSAPIHATISGTVNGVSKVPNPTTGEPIRGILIESNEDDEWVKFSAADPDDLPIEEILNRIKEAGIVGLGGAAFPTHVKLQPPEDKPVHTVIVNGAECEPYITSDDRLMREETGRIVGGLLLIMKALSAKKAYIAIEDNKPKPISRISEAVSQADTPYPIKVAPLRARYPMGAEKTLVKALLGTEVPEGGLPMDVGVVVQNVATVAAIYDAVVEGKPLVERIVTVTGDVPKPKNLIARFGTSAMELIEYCGGPSSGANKLVFGGPMMGIAQPTYYSPLIKSTNCLLVLKSKQLEEHQCIRCGRCVQRCPMGLMPLVFAKAVQNGLYEQLSEYHIDSCVECGACTYDCPANIPIVSYIKTGKQKLQKVTEA